MGIFKSKNGERRPPGFLSMVLLQEPMNLPGTEIAQRASEMSPSRPIRFLGGGREGDEQGALEFECDTCTLFAMSLPFAVPTDEVDQCVQTSAFWNNEAGHVEHGAHVVLVAKTGKEPTDPAWVSSRIAAAILELCNGSAW